MEDGKLVLGVAEGGDLADGRTLGMVASGRLGNFSCLKDFGNVGVGAFGLESGGNALGDGHLG